MTYFPAARILGHPDGESALALAALPAGGLFLAADLALWRAGVSRYLSTGS